MGLLQALRLNRNAANAPTPQIASPWSDSSNLQSIVLADILGEDYAGVTRGMALSVPAVARGRRLICSTVAGCNVEVFTKDGLLESQPTWTYRSDLGISPYHRMLWTIDDLLFYGWSLWTVYRGEAGQLLDAARVPFEWWDFEEDGTVRIDHDGLTETPSADEIILIPGPDEGVLSFGTKAIRQAAGLAEAALKAAELPSAHINLHYTGDKQLTEDEIKDLIAWWVKARRGENGGVAFTNKLVEVEELGAAKEQLLIEGRNAASVDVARLLGIPASMIDATTATASLTYETTQGRNGEFIDYGLQPYFASVAGRLSLDDVVPRGQSVRFDTTELRTLTPSPTGANTED